MRMPSGSAGGGAMSAAAKRFEMRSSWRIGHMTKDELSAWALGNGWQDMGGFISLVRPTKPSEAIVRMVFKATVVQLEIKKPAGKWDKVKSESYEKIVFDEHAELPRGIGLTTISGLTMLMRDNKDRLAFSKLSGKS
jgi:hypothetical protein